MAKIKFNVSARTARLIGRENVSNPNGALIELIKNCHDADAGEVILLFDIKYNCIPKKLNIEEFSELADKDSFVAKCFKLVGNEYHLRELKIGDEERLALILKSFNRIFLCDNGHGMSIDTIENHWMTIGTNNKLENPHSPDGRVKSGAKGIGRFALDRLGSKCEMITFSKAKAGLKWVVDWEDFERPNKKIDEVTAELYELKNSTYSHFVGEKIIKHFSVKNIKPSNFEYGTLISVSSLRDWWSHDEIDKSFSGLESLIPPNFQKKFKIYFIDSKRLDNYGVIKNTDYLDYDYKIEAKFTNDQKIKIKLFRNEFDYKSFPKEFFNLKRLNKEPYRKKDFEQTYIEIEKTLQDLLETTQISEEVFNKIGPFDMNFIFMKRGYSSPDKKKFFYKEFSPDLRKERLALYGGVKIFRDNFKVRPYGEVNGNSFDWLGLGERVTLSPAGPTHKGGRWRVRAAQVMGSLNISRIQNEMFEDKSSREGLQENEVFSAFKNLVISIIEIFENDRQTIMRELNSLFIVEDENQKKIDEADELLKKYKKSSSKGASKQGDKKNDEQNKFIEAYIAQKSQIKDLIDENKLLVGLASTGLTISSFSHELKNIKSNLNLKTSNLEKYIHESIDKEIAKKLPDFKDPRILVLQLQSINKRLNNWLTFTLECVKQDKRKRKKIVFEKYFKNLETIWSESLVRLHTKIQFVNESKKNIEKRMFELDLDSIFNNLIVNSISAFEDRKDGKIKREINIQYSIKNGNIVINYSDTGPGLDSSIKDKEKIFEAHFTTKKNEVGDTIGTGMGMWIVQKAVRDYKGIIEIDDKNSGFSLEIRIPIDE